MPSEFLLIYRFLGNIVSDQILPAVRRFFGRCCGDADSGKFRHAGLDLPKFDPKSADLDLGIDTAEMLERPVRPPFRQVSRVVHFGAVSLVKAVKRVVHELLLREPGKVKISCTDTVAADAQFACGSKRKQFTLGIQNIDLCICDRRADMYIIRAFDLRDSRIHCRLRRSIIIKYVGFADLPNLGHNMVQKGLPAQDHGLKIGDELFFTSEIHQKFKSGRRSREQVGLLPPA